MASALDPTGRCPDCGMAFLEFRRQGRLGCARDYDVFREQLRTLIERLHRSTQHRGKHPRENCGPVTDFSDQRRLRRELAAAVDGDDYQLAARIRDELREKDREDGS